MTKILSASTLGGVFVALALPSLPAHAVLFTGSGTVGGNSVSASATFGISGNTLSIVLQNTSPANSLEAPTNTLSGISFLLNGQSPALTPVSAISPNAIFDSAACDVTLCGGTNVNVGGFTSAGLGLTNVEGIGAAGYITTGLAHDSGNFDGVDLQSPASLNAINFSILSAEERLH